MMYKLWISFHILRHADPFFLAPSVEETLSFLPGLISAYLSNISWLWVTFGDFYSVPLACKSTFLPVPGYFDYNFLIVCLEVWYYVPAALFLWFEFAFNILGSLCVCINVIIIFLDLRRMS